MTQPSERIPALPPRDNRWIFWSAFDFSLPVTLCSISVDFSHFKGKYSWPASSVRQFSQHRRKTMPSKFCLVLSSTALRFIQYLCFVSSQHMEDVLRSQLSAAILLHNFFFLFFSFQPLHPRPLARPPPPLHYGRTNSYGSLKADWPLQPSEENTSQAVEMSWTLRSDTFLPLIRERRRKVTFSGKGSSLASPRIYLLRRLIINLSLRRTRL